MRILEDGIELVYGRPIDYIVYKHIHTLAGFDHKKLVKIYYSLADRNYVIMSWHCLHAEYQKDSFADSKSEAIQIALNLYNW